MKINKRTISNRINLYGLVCFSIGGIFSLKNTIPIALLGAFLIWHFYKNIMDYLNCEDCEDCEFEE